MVKVSRLLKEPPSIVQYSALLSVRFVIKILNKKFNLLNKAKYNQIELNVKTTTEIVLVTREMSTY